MGMSSLKDEEILRIYAAAKKNRLSEEFIVLIWNEIIKRKLEDMVLDGSLENASEENLV
ncbi:sporulation histidine kinase inhibitor Sda [Falsibacillus albus]|nr:sporulation histidine kinase inhibitor Sda [Falsibacillus albus]